MRFLLIFMIAGLLSGPFARATSDPRRAQVAAATADALDALQRDVLAAPITADLSIGQFIDRTRSRDTFAQTLRRAQQIGGARWLDEQTCQVRMALPGDDVVDALAAIARANPREAGLPADALRQRLEPLRETTFAATGMSTRAVDRLRPPPEREAWRGVSDQTLRAAIEEARRSAARQVLDSADAIPLVEDKTRLEAVLDDPRVRDAMESWLMNQPVTSVDFRGDLEVRVAVCVEGDGFFDELSAAVGDRRDLPFPQTERGRASLRRQMLGLIEPTVGRAVARSDGASRARSTPPPSASGDTAGGIPCDPPKWLADQVEVRGSSRAVDGRLKTARAAEAVARGRLRDRLEELPLTRTLTLGEAARRDPDVRAALDRALSGVRSQKVNYLSDGSAEVSLSIELRDLWHELERR